MFAKNITNKESIATDAPGKQNDVSEPVEAELAKTQRDDDSRPRSCSYVGPTLHIKGEVTVEESLSIDGKIEGTIKSKDKKLTVGKQGQVNAKIHASVVEARGRIDGDIHCKDIVHLYSTAIVTGTIQCERLIVDDGAAFEGRISTNKEQKAAPSKRKLKLADTDSADDLAKAAS